MKLRKWFMLYLIYYMRRVVEGSHIYNYKMEFPSGSEKFHYPGLYMTTLAPYRVNGTSTIVASRDYTPDFRIEEHDFTVYSKYFLREEERPYRLSPHYKQTKGYEFKDRANNLGCYCCTVYRRHILLGACAILTVRHVLTTATSTEIILRNYKHKRHLEGILGLWYDVDWDVQNSSLYATPARIHYHPQYVRDFEVNVSHPIPCQYDLALWAMTHKFSYTAASGVIVCQRAASSWREFASTVPRYYDVYTIVGWLFMKAYHRRPMPWFKYGVRTQRFQVPCPKTEWGWFHCLIGDWAKYGMDSGAAMHFMDRGNTHRLDGFAGMCAFSLKLRSTSLLHYFTVIDTYPVLDFLYLAFMGRLPYDFLDNRFWDTQWNTPRLYYGESVHINFAIGFQHFYDSPNYRRRR